MSLPAAPHPAKALLFQLSGLGDTLFFLPALAAWKARHPELHTTALTMFPAVRDLLRHTPLIDEVIHRDFLREPKGESLAFFTGLRRYRFDYGVLPYGSNRIEYNIAQWLAGSRERLAHRYRLALWRNLSFLNNLRTSQRADRHAVEANGDLLAAGGLIGAGALAPLPGDWLRIPDAARAGAETRLRTIGGRRFIGVHAGSNPLKNQHRKCYPPALLAAALQAIAAQNGDRFFLLFEGKSDGERTAALAQALTASGTPFLRLGPEDILECAALIDRCEFFIGNDSGLVHLAAARGRPCLAIFGPTNSVFGRPWGVPAESVLLGLPCQPCFDYSARPLTCKRDIDFACVRDLPPAYVVAAFKKLAKRVE